ncbi:hypothetical protein KR222_005047 [Zaprionus bogoriensis]|nr:hypothetical protein KR222_005047 [Zaprionus bogoriensis]
MINTAKYFVLLENLSFEHATPKQHKPNEQQAVCSFAANLSLLEQYVKLEVSQQLQELCAALQCDAAGIETEDPISCYIIRLLHVLHTLASNINFHSDAKEDLISVAHLKLCIQTTQELAYHALRQQLHPDFYRSPVFQAARCDSAQRCPPALVLLCVQLLLRLLPIRQLHIANSMELVQRDLLAAIVSLRLEQLSPAQGAQLQAALAYLWTHESKADFFRHVLLLKATPQLCAPLAKELHQLLLAKLQAAQGFGSLVAALQTADSTRSAEIVANIVAQRGYSQRLQLRLIQQIFEYLAQSSACCAAGVLSLRRLCELSDVNRQCIAQSLRCHWQPLTAPEDLISGLIIWEQAQLCDCLRRWQQLFCSSSVACLPSSLLVEYLPLLLQLYKQLPETQLQARHALCDLICRCLDNRKSELELVELLQLLFKGTADWQSLHPRVAIVCSAQTQQLAVQVAKEQEQQLEQEQVCRVLPSLLLAGNNHALSCKVFLALLSLVLQQLAEPMPAQSHAIDLLSTEAELADFLQRKYQLKLELLVALDQLVWHEPLKAQLADSSYSKQFVQLVCDLLQVEAAQQQQQQQVDQTLVVILLLLQEILERSEQLQLAESTRRLQQPLQRLAQQTDNALVRNAVQPLLQLLNGDAKRRPPAQGSFQTARELIEQQQPHLQVYGIQMMLQALRSKDPAFTSQAHRILALALSTLKHKESYTFLNCVRLFVALVHLMEAEVLDMLSDEYLSEACELDYRLVVGEAVLKAAQEIGPLCYRYKGPLLNCFLHGCRSPLDEFRSSSYANLAQLCRLLGYQVQSFFQELLQLIDAELSTGRYLPTKRGALLVLAELLAGMESLLDYQEMLLPIYRLLRTIEAAESCDPQMRQHAANGLKTLNEKCRELLSSESLEQVQREIKVLGIKEPRSDNKKKHILELN